MVFTATVARASDPVPVQSTPDSAALSSAKDQLDELKTADVGRRAGNETKLAPRLPVTQLSPGNEFVAPRAKPRSHAQHGQQSENWLVDAMMRPDGTPRSGSGKDAAAAGKTDPRGNPLDSTSSATRSDQLLNDDEREDDALEANEVTAEQPGAIGNTTAVAPQGQEKIERPPDSYNPLAKYMSDWLSPQDLPLLKSAVESVKEGAPLGSAASSSPSDSSELLGIDAFTDHSAGPAAKPEDNPYLQFWKAPDAVPVAPPPPADAPSTATASSLFAPPPADSRPSQATVPDFAKPDLDDKYFKPLKRF